MSEADFNVIDTEVGLLGGTILLVGNVVAMTVFLLPAHLIADEGVGPELALVMVVIAIPMTFSILGKLQVGGAMPTAGGAYVYASRLIHPFFGFMLPWLVVPAIWAGQLYLAYGFAEFMRFFELTSVAGVTLFSEVHIAILMYAVMIPFIILNVLGIRIVAQVQMILVAIIVVGMLLFIVPGSMAVDTANYTPMFEDGYGPFFVALISLSIAMHGFGLATDLGEELKDPVKNIPRVLGLSAVVSITLMSLVVIVAVGVVPLDAYLESGAPGGENAVPLDAGVAVAAFEFLPGWGAAFVALAAVVGAFTSLNTLYTAYSRQIMRAARDETIPLYFAKVHPEYQSPYRAILLLGLPALLLVPLAPSPVIMSSALAIASMVGAVLSAFALWNLPKRFPDRYEYSIYKLPMPLLKVVAVGGGAVSLLFLLGASTELWWLTGGILGWILLAYPVYRYRVWSVRKNRGIDLRERMKGLHTYENQRAESGSTAADGDDVASPTDALDGSGAGNE